MNSTSQLGAQSGMAASYSAPPSVEQDGSPGSLLGELQALENQARALEKSVEEHTHHIGNVLLPEMKPEVGGNTAPEPMRSAYATRVNSVMRTLRQIEVCICSLTERAKLT